MATATKVLDTGVVASACLPMENVKHTTWLTGNKIITRKQNNGLFFILSLYCSRFFCMPTWPEVKPALCLWGYEIAEIRLTRPIQKSRIGLKFHSDGSTMMLNR
jgi:hypothetical protein